jgi:hypothetical protein
MYITASRGLCMQVSHQQGHFVGRCAARERSGGVRLPLSGILPRSSPHPHAPLPVAALHFNGRQSYTHKITFLFFLHWQRRGLLQCPQRSSPARNPKGEAQRVWHLATNETGVEHTQERLGITGFRSPDATLHYQGAPLGRS